MHKVTRRESLLPRSRTAFTLIELLAVITVIIILVGISLKVTSAINRKTADAKTIYVLEQTRNALEGYYLAMNRYPDVNTTRSTHAPNTSKWAWVPDDLREEKGLVYHFLWMDHPQKASWQRYVRDVSPAVVHFDGYSSQSESKAGGGGITWSNLVYRILDGYGNEIYYRPDTNNFSSYTLWSAGPDGKTVVDGKGSQADAVDDITGIADL